MKNTGFWENTLPGWGRCRWSTRIKDFRSVISISACRTIPFLPGHCSGSDRHSCVLQFRFRIWSFRRQSRTFNFRDGHGFIPVLLGPGTGQLLKFFSSTLLLRFLETICSFLLWKYPALKYRRPSLFAVLTFCEGKTENSEGKLLVLT